MLGEWAGILLRSLDIISEDLDKTKHFFLCNGSVHNIKNTSDMDWSVHNIKNTSDMDWCEFYITFAQVIVKLTEMTQQSG